MNRKILLAVFFPSCIFLFSGCAFFSGNSGEQALLEPQPVSRFSDIPVPLGLKMLPESSYSFESPGVRVAVLKYQGKVDADRVINFYKEQMPIYNWSLINIIEYGQRLMNFERENESCIITILPKGSSLVMTISLGPKSQGLTRRTGSLSETRKKTLDK